MKTSGLEFMTHATLLIVEDDEDICSHLSRVMTSEGYRVHTAHNRFEALAFDHQPMIVLLDMGLPPASHGISEGLILLDALLAGSPGSKIIAITGHEDAAFEAVRRGAFDFLTKPSEISDIKSAIRRASLFLHHERLLSESGEARLHITIKISDGPRECAEAIEEQIIRHTLSDTNGNVSETARRLGLVRENLYYYLKKYGIRPSRPQSV